MSSTQEIGPALSLFLLSLFQGEQVQVVRAETEREREKEKDDCGIENVANVG